VTAQPRPTPCSQIHMFFLLVPTLQGYVHIICLLPIDDGSSGHYIQNDIVLVKTWSNNATRGSNNATKNNTLIARSCSSKYVLLKAGGKLLGLLSNDWDNSAHSIGVSIVLVKIWSNNTTRGSDCINQDQHPAHKSICSSY
jgi:hypothetical protein